MFPTAVVVATLLVPTPRLDSFGEPLPPGAVLRLGSSAFRVFDNGGVGFRPAGELAALAGPGATLYKWPPGRTTPQVVRLAEDADPWYKALSPDARYAAGVLKTGVTVWDVSGAAPSVVTVRPFKGVHRLYFSPAGTWFAVNYDAPGGGPGRIALCHLPTRVWRELPHTVSHLACLSFSADEKRFVTVSSSVVRVFDPAHGGELLEHQCSGFRPGWAALTPDGGTVAVLPMDFASQKEPPVQFREVPSGKVKDGWTPPPGGGQWVAFTPGGKTLLVGGRNEVREWDPVAGKEVRLFTGPAAAPPVYSADGTRAASHSQSAVLLWDARTGNLVHPKAIADGHLGAVLGVTVSPDGRVVATNDLTGDVRTWAADTGRPLARIASTWGNDRRTVFTPDSRLLIAVDPDYVTPVARDPRTGRVVRRFAAPADRLTREMTHCLRLSADGTSLCTLQLPNSLRDPTFAVRWDIGTGEPTERTRLANVTRLDLDVSFRSESPNGTWVVRSGTATRVSTGESVAIVPPRDTGGMIPARFSDDGRLVAQIRNPWSLIPLDPAIDDVVVFDLVAKARLVALPTGRIQRLTVSPDGRTIAVVAQTEVSVWEIASGKRAARFQLASRPYIRREAIAFTPDGRRLLTGEDDCTVLVWDLTGGPPGAADPDRLWAALAGADSEAAYRAGWALADQPREALALARWHLAPAIPISAAELEKLVQGLDAGAFADREAAEKALRGRIDAAAPDLRERLRDQTSAEQRQRIDRLLKEADLALLPAGDRLRAVRAVAVVERIGGPEARTLLKELAGGLTTARLTREATAALARLGDNPPPMK